MLEVNNLQKRMRIQPFANEFQNQSNNIDLQIIKSFFIRKELFRPKEITCGYRTVQQIFYQQNMSEQISKIKQEMF